MTRRLLSTARGSVCASRAQRIRLTEALIQADAFPHGRLRDHALHHVRLAEATPIPCMNNLKTNWALEHKSYSWPGLPC
jgi:hypothetical protein